MLQEIPCEKMCVINGERKVPVQSPFQHRVRLVANVTGVTGIARLDQIDRRPINAIVRVFTPKTIPVQGQGEIF